MNRSKTVVFFTLWLLAPIGFYALVIVILMVWKPKADGVLMACSGLVAFACCIVCSAIIAKRQCIAAGFATFFIIAIFYVMVAYLGAVAAVIANGGIGT